MPYSVFSVAVILGVALTLRLWGIGFGLPHTLARPDEDAVASIALRVFGRNLNPGFFDWPSLFMYLVAAGYVVYFNVGRMLHWFPREAAFLAAGNAAPAPLYLIARCLSAAAGVLTVRTVYGIGTRLFDRTTALLGAAYLAVAALHVRESHFGLPDVTSTWLLTVSFLFTVKYERSRRSRDALLAALVAGLAASTKYNAGLIILPAVWAIVRRSSNETRTNGQRLALLSGSLLLAAAAFVVATPYALLTPTPLFAALGSIGAHLRNGHIALSGYGWRIHLTSSLRYGIGVPMLAAGVIGLALALWRDKRSGALLAMFPVTYFLLIGAGQTTFARYILPVVPFLCVAAAFLTVETGRAIARRTGRLNVAPSITCVLACLVAARSSWSAVQTDRLLVRADNRLLAAGWIHARFPLGATIYQSGSLYAHLQMQTADAGAADRYHEVTFNEDSALFFKGEGQPTMAPDLIVVPECPLAYCGAPGPLTPILSKYVRLAALTSVDNSDSRLKYDREDAFFVPLSGFGAVIRPGPNVVIYGRRH